MRIKGICKGCRHSYLYYGNGGKHEATGVRCSVRNGRIKKPMKQCPMFSPPMPLSEEVMYYPQVEGVTPTVVTPKGEES